MRALENFFHNFIIFCPFTFNELLKNVVGLVESCATSCLNDKSQPNIYFQWHRRFLRFQGKPEQRIVGFNYDSYQ